MEKKRIIFFGGSSIFAVPALKKLAENYEIALIVTNPAKSIGRKQIPGRSMTQDRAEKMGIPVINAEKITSEIIEKIKGLKTDFFVIIDYGKIIPQKLLDIPPYGAINVHPSALPKYRGASPLQNAILNGEKETAISIMLIDAKVDHGPILAQKNVGIRQNDTWGELYKRLSSLYPKFLAETLKKYLSGKIKPVPQDDSRATFTKILLREDGKINWSKTAIEIERMVRAYNPWPGTYTEWNGKRITGYPTPYSSLHLSSESGTRLSGSLKRIKILKATISKNDYSDKKTGELFKTNDKKLVAKCGKGTLILEQVQPEGKRSMSGEEFIHGYLR